MVNATATDASGNTSAGSSVTVDSVAPATPVINPSNGTTLSGTAEPGSSVTLTDGNGNPIGQVTADGSGNWSFTPSTPLADYDEVERLAVEHKPKMIVAGFSAYSQVLDFARFRAIADKVGAYLFVDMAHVAGLVAAGVYPNPVPFADVVTTTTHKTLRGPRGGLILARANEEIEKKLNSAAA